MLGDVAVGLIPVTDRDAAEMAGSLRAFALLQGHGGAPPADVAALEDVVLRVGQLAENHAEIAEMDANPVVVHRRGATVVDARIRVERASQPPLAFAR